MVQKIQPCGVIGAPLLCIFKRCNSRECSVHFFRGPWFMLVHYDYLDACCVIRLILDKLRCSHKSLRNPLLPITRLLINKMRSNPSFIYSYSSFYFHIQKQMLQSTFWICFADESMKKNIKSKIEETCITTLAAQTAQKVKYVHVLKCGL